jgi:hypothetical protein
MRLYSGHRPVKRLESWLLALIIHVGLCLCHPQRRFVQRRLVRGNANS